MNTSREYDTVRVARLTMIDRSFDGSEDVKRPPEVGVVGRFRSERVGICIEAPMTVRFWPKAALGGCIVKNDSLFAVRRRTLMFPRKHIFRSGQQSSRGRRSFWGSRMKIRDLRGLGPKSEEQLKAVGISTPEELRAVGAVTAFVALCETSANKPSLNFLYALVGALEDRDWRDVARKDRDRLFSELDGHHELRQLFDES